MDTVTPTEERMNKLLDMLVQSVESIKDTADVQLPLLAQEILSQYFWTAVLTTVWGCVFWSIAIASGVIAKRLLRHADLTDDRFLSGVVCCCAAVIFTLIGSFPVIAGTAQLVRACTAPRLVVLEHIRRLM